MEARSVILGHVLRGGSPSGMDRILATRFGHKAADLLAAGRFNELVVVQHGALTSVPITDVAEKQRLVPVEDDLVRAARAVGTSFGD